MIDEGSEAELATKTPPPKGENLLVKSLFDAMENDQLADVLEIVGLVKKGVYQFDPETTFRGRIRNFCHVREKSVATFFRKVLGHNVSRYSRIEDHPSKSGDIFERLDVDQVKPYVLAYVYTLYGGRWNRLFEELVSISNCGPMDTIFGIPVVTLLTHKRVGADKAGTAVGNYLMYNFKIDVARGHLRDSIFWYHSASYRKILCGFGAGHITTLKQNPLLRLIDDDNVAVAGDLVTAGDRSSLFAGTDYVAYVERKASGRVPFLTLLLDNGHPFHGRYLTHAIDGDHQDSIRFYLSRPVVLEHVAGAGATGAPVSGEMISYLIRHDHYELVAKILSTTDCRHLLTGTRNYLIDVEERVPEATRLKFVRLLVDHGADPTARPAGVTESALEVAIRLCHFDTVTYYVSNYEVVPHFAGARILHHMLGHMFCDKLVTAVVTQAERLGIDVVTATDEKGRTPLHILCEGVTPTLYVDAFREVADSVAQILVRNGADPYARDHTGKTPIDILTFTRRVYRLARVIVDAPRPPPQPTTPTDGGSHTGGAGGP